MQFHDLLVALRGRGKHHLQRLPERPQPDEGLDLFLRVQLRAYVRQVCLFDNDGWVARWLARSL